MHLLSLINTFYFANHGLFHQLRIFFCILYNFQSNFPPEAFGAVKKKLFKCTHVPSVHDEAETFTMYVCICNIIVYNCP